MRKCQVHDCLGKLRLQAAALEEAIYCQIRHQQLHQQTDVLVVPHDEASLNLQLGHLLRRLAQQQRRRRATNTIQHKDTPRSRALRGCLGKVRYARLQSLLLQIQNLGVAHSFCGGSSCSTNNNNNITLPGHTKAPQPIRQLFFQTRLVPAVNQTPVAQLACITTSQWDGWLDEAERHIRGYHVWSQQYDGRESGCRRGDAPTGAAGVLTDDCDILCVSAGESEEVPQRLAAL